MNWEEQLRRNIRRLEDLPKEFVVSKEELEFFRRIKNMETSRSGVSYMPFSVTEYFLSLSDYTDPNCPIRRQFMPDPRELEESPMESDDPLYEERYRVSPRLIHRYRNRVLLLVTNFCPLNCRYCFRRYYKEMEPDVISKKELELASRYIGEHREVKEVLLSGGDPLSLSDSKLESIITRLRESRDEIVIRIGSRVLSVLPDRITDSLIEVFKRHKPIWFVAHFNHPKELSPRVLDKVELLVDSGIPILNQSVLLRGINDDPQVLAELFEILVRNRVKPYYIFQCDLARGTSHFRVPIERGLTIMERLREVLSGVGMPDYALDLPGGGGKVSLFAVDIERRGDNYIIKKREGSREEYVYPV